MTQIEYTIPTSASRVQRVGGPVTARRPPPADRASFDDGGYWQAQRRYEARQYRLAHPDDGVYGCGVPYNVRLPDPTRGDVLVFDTDTLWLGPPTVALQLEHGGTHLGHATVTEERNGVYVDGTIYNGLRNRVKDRRQLSVKIDQLDLTPRPDGTMHVDQARLVEVSLVHTAAWRPLTDATIWQRAA